MREDLKVFENRSDDWLAKERAYEESVSAWDLDEGKKLKKQHELRHERYEKTHPDGGVIGKPIKQNDFVDLNTKKVARVISIILIAVFVILVVNVVSEIGSSMLSSLLEFLPFVVFIIIFASFTRRKNK